MYRALGFGIRLIAYKRKALFYSIVDCFLEAVKKHPQKAFIHFEGKTYSYEEVDKESNKVADALRSVAGLKEGDTVALFLENEPYFVWTWLGLAKLGCPAALLNFNIRSKSLLHCFSCCGASVLIAAAGERHTYALVSRVTLYSLYIRTLAIHGCYGSVARTDSQPNVHLLFSRSTLLIYSHVWNIYSTSTSKK